jgi:hypothetical protein
MKPVYIGKDKSRYDLRLAKPEEYTKLRLKFPNMDGQKTIFVIEREGAIVGLAEGESMLYLYQIHLTDQNKLKKTKTIIAMAELMRETANQSGSGALVFCHGSQKAIQKILKRYGCKKLHRAHSCIYIYH